MVSLSIPSTSGVESLQFLFRKSIGAEVLLRLRDQILLLLQIRKFVIVNLSIFYTVKDGMFLIVLSEVETSRIAQFRRISCAAFLTVWIGHLKEIGVAIAVTPGIQVLKSRILASG